MGQRLEGAVAMIECLNPSEFALFLSIVIDAVEVLGDGVIRVGPAIWTRGPDQWCVTGEAA